MDRRELTARGELQELLVHRFSSGQFERFVHAYFEPCVHDVPWRASSNEQAHAFLRAISARGLEDSLWQALRQERPLFIDDIDAIAARWVAAARENAGGPADEPADNCVLEPTAYYDRGELASHAHANAPRALGGAAEALDELTRWLARPDAGALFVI
jgi:hypothetical protein